MSNDADYLFLESQLIDRIGADIGNAAKVYGAPDMSVVAAQQPDAPAIYVLYRGDKIKTGAPQQGSSRKIQTMSQDWMTVLVLPNTGEITEGQSVHQSAGPMIGKLIDILTGWTPDNCSSPLQRARCKLPPHYANGFFYYPINWRVQFVYPRLRTWQPTF